jgi:hypothetical protein
MIKAFLYICVVKVKQITILSFWLIAFFWGAMGSAWAYSSSTPSSLVNYSKQSFKNNQLGHSFSLDGTEDVVPQQEKIGKEGVYLLLFTKQHSLQPLSADYNFTHEENIYNPRDVLGTQIYPSHFFW